MSAKSAKIHDFTRRHYLLQRRQDQLSATFIALGSGVSCGDVLAIRPFQGPSALADRLESYVVDEVYYEVDDPGLAMFVAIVHYERGLLIEGDAESLYLRWEPDGALVRARKLAASYAASAQLDEEELKELFAWLRRSAARTTDHRAYIRKTHPTARSVETKIGAPEGRLGCVWDGHPDDDIGAIARLVAADLGIDLFVALSLCEMAKEEREVAASDTYREALDIGGQLPTLTPKTNRRIVTSISVGASIHPDPRDTLIAQLRAELAEARHSMPEALAGAGWERFEGSVRLADGSEGLIVRWVRGTGDEDPDVGFLVGPRGPMMQEFEADPRLSFGEVAAVMTCELRRHGGVS